MPQGGAPLAHRHPLHALDRNHEMRDPGPHQPAPKRPPQSGQLERALGRLDAAEQELDAGSVGSPAGLHHPGVRVEPHAAVPAEAEVERHARHAAGAVAAELGRLPVGVPVAHREIQLGVGLDEQHAIGAHAAPPIAEPAHERSRLVLEERLAVVDHHEIVRGAMHLEEGNLHEVFRGSARLDTAPARRFRSARPARREPGGD